MMRMRLRSMGIKIKPPSKARTRPAPREVQTEKVRPFNAANLVLVNWYH
jgi:hypothetical protein